VSVRRAARGVLAALALVLAAGSALRGLDGPADPEIERGVRQVQEGELQAGIATLEGAVLRPGVARRDVALAHVWIGIAHLGLDRPGPARASMQAARDADPTLALSPDEFPPHVVLVFQEAVAAAPVAPPPVPAPESQPGRPPEKKGHGRAYLIGGAAAVAAGGIALAAGGPAPSPSPSPLTCTDPAQSGQPAFDFPTNGATIRGVVSVSCQPPAGFPTACIQFIAYAVLPQCERTFSLIGQPSAAPYTAVWDSATVPNGVHCLECGLWDRQGRPGPVQHVTVTVAN
jgi:hypothetical protein